MRRGPDPTVSHSDETAEAGPSGSPPRVDIGWLVLSALSAEQRASVERAREGVLAILERYSQFQFQIEVHRRGAASEEVEPVTLLDMGAAELDAARWDFAFVITNADLRAYRKPFCIGAPASSLNIAVVSLARLERHDDLTSPSTERLARRIENLVLHLFGHLNDLSHASDPTDYMFDVTAPGDLDAMQGFSGDGERRLMNELAREADERVEERTSGLGVVRFYVEAIRQNKSDIVHAVLKIQPWFFITRLSRLTTTAVSTAILLLLTGEAWDVGVHQSVTSTFVAGFVTVCVTSVYVLYRQRLFARLRNKALTEQRAVANVSVSVGVWLGMSTAYALLFSGSLIVARALHSPRVVARWVGQTGSAPLFEYVEMAGFVATVGVLLGALGASFESESYFRHVALVDEET